MSRAAWVAGVIGSAVLALPGGAIAPTAVYAGTWADVMCAQPNGQPAQTQNWVSGTTGGLATNGCNPYAGGLIAQVDSAAALPPLAGATWTFTAPAGSTIAGGSVTLSPYAPQGLAYLATPGPAYDPADVIAACETGFPCGGQVDGELTETVPITHPGGTSLYAIAHCLAPGGGGCPAAGGGANLDAEINVYQATVELSSGATPAASGFGGALLAPGPVAGTQPITLTATDSGGPGVYKITIAVDGHPVYDATPDTNSGQCASIGTDQNGIPEFLSPQPCKTTVSVSATVDTTLLADGPHDLSATVTDSAGNTSVVLRQTIVTENRTTVSAALDSSLTPSTPGASTATETPGAVYAIVLDPPTQALARGTHRTFARSALALSGTLRNSDGVPAPGVAVTLLAQNGGQGSAQQLARATSDATGHWTLTAPRGPSRKLTIVPGTQAQTAAAQTGLAINERVTPGLSLRVRALSRGRLRFTGKLAITPIGSPRPLVFIEARSGNHWQVIANATHTTNTGAYTLTYTAKSKTIGQRYEFRAFTPATSLYTAATSATRQATVK